MASCYVLYSPSRDQYYIGSTHGEFVKRLDQHQTEYYGSNHFTSGTKDWEELLVISCASFSQARKIENHIKRMKSRVYIKNLKAYPEMIIKLLVKYKD